MPTEIVQALETELLLYHVIKNIPPSDQKRQIITESGDTAPLSALLVSQFRKFSAKTWLLPRPTLSVPLNSSSSSSSHSTSSSSVPSSVISPLDPLAVTDSIPWKEVKLSTSLIKALEILLASAPHTVHSLVAHFAPAMRAWARKQLKDEKELKDQHVLKRMRVLYRTHIAECIARNQWREAIQAFTIALTHLTLLPSNPTTSSSTSAEIVAESETGFESIFDLLIYLIHFGYGRQVTECLTKILPRHSPALATSLSQEMLPMQLQLRPVQKAKQPDYEDKTNTKQTATSGSATKEKQDQLDRNAIEAKEADESTTRFSAIVNDYELSISRKTAVYSALHSTGHIQLALKYATREDEIRKSIRSLDFSSTVSSLPVTPSQFEGDFFSQFLQRSQFAYLFEDIENNTLSTPSNEFINLFWSEYLIYIRLHNVHLFEYPLRCCLQFIRLSDESNNNNNNNTTTTTTTINDNNNNININQLYKINFILLLFSTITLFNYIIRF